MGVCTCGAWYESVWACVHVERGFACVWECVHIERGKCGIGVCKCGARYDSVCACVHVKRDTSAYGSMYTLSVVLHAYGRVYTLSVVRMRMNVERAVTAQNSHCSI